MPSSTVLPLDVLQDPSTPGREADPLMRMLTVSDSTDCGPVKRQQYTSSSCWLPLALHQQVIAAKYVFTVSCPIQHFLIPSCFAQSIFCPSTFLLSLSNRFFVILLQLLSHQPSRNCSSSAFLGLFASFSVRFSSLLVQSISLLDRSVSHISLLSYCSLFY
jgi:hypothetical protein